MLADMFRSTLSISCETSVLVQCNGYTVKIIPALQYAQKGNTKLRYMVEPNYHFPFYFFSMITYFFAEDGASNSIIIKSISPFFQPC
jgi:hypothetical protein